MRYCASGMDEQISYSDPAPVEPSAAMLGLARMSRELYLSHLRAGFTEPQAERIVGVFIATAVSNAQGGK